MKPEPEIIRSSRIYALVLVIGSLLFVYLGTWTIHYTRSRHLILGTNLDVLVGWAGIGFFGLCALVSAVIIIRPVELRLSAEGFTFTSFLKTKQVRWQDIDAFVLTSFFKLPFIGYNYSPRRSRLKFLPAPWGLDAPMPGFWVIPASELVDKLNDYRRRSLGG